MPLRISLPRHSLVLQPLLHTYHRHQGHCSLNLRVHFLKQNLNQLDPCLEEILKCQALHQAILHSLEELPLKPLRKRLMKRRMKMIRKQMKKQKINRSFHFSFKIPYQLLVLIFLDCQTNRNPLFLISQLQNLQNLLLQNLKRRVFSHRTLWNKISQHP